ncbi:molybdate ABC transporter substrate-binding protein, partial [Microbacteriaceae bacterium K1510]|nr:molybdate ABC transporter substrate-binding protein [Microbacteriaceae bacterium K1510]
MKEEIGVLKRFVYSWAALLVLLVPLGCSSNHGENQLSAQQPAGQPSSARPDGAAPQPAEKAELIISAAASLTDAMNELKRSFESEHPTITLIYNFGSSGKLAQQIEQGAPADLFLSASKK